MQKQKKVKSPPTHACPTSERKQFSQLYDRFLQEGSISGEKKMDNAISPRQ